MAIRENLNTFRKPHCCLWKTMALLDIVTELSFLYQAKTCHCIFYSVIVTYTSLKQCWKKSMSSILIHWFYFSSVFNFSNQNALFFQISLKEHGFKFFIIGTWPFEHTLYQYFPKHALCDTSSERYIFKKDPMVVFTCERLKTIPSLEFHQIC